MTGADIVRAAIPGASDHLVDHIVWGRTPFPVGHVGARDLFKAADRWRRAAARGITLCDWCDNMAAPFAWTCYRCQAALTPTGSETTSPVQGPVLAWQWTARNKRREP